MNIPVNPIGVPPEEPNNNEVNNSKISSESFRPNTPDNAAKELSPKQKMQIKIRKVKEKKPKQPLLLAAIALILALYFVVGNITAPFTAPSTSGYANKGVQLTFLGDVMLGRYIQAEGKKNGYEQFYKNVKGVWDKSDYVFANLETSVLTSKKATYKPLEDAVPISTDTEAIASMMDSGINAVSFANNHSCDYRKKAFLGALKWFEKKKLNYAGYIDKNAYNASKDTANQENEEAKQYKPYTQLIVNDKKIGFIAVTSKFYAKTINYGLLTTADSNLNNYINESAVENDLTVVYAHWGENSVKEPDKKQQELAHQFIDAGADIVIGTHPHILQKVEKYNKGIVFYSLGDFIMDQNTSFNCDSVIVQYNEDSNGKVSFELVPVRISNGCPSITSNPLYKARIRKSLMSGYDKSQYHVTESGNIIIDF